MGMAERKAAKQLEETHLPRLKQELDAALRALTQDAVGRESRQGSLLARRHPQHRGVDA